MNSVWNNIFFARQAIAKITFVLNSTNARDTPYPFGLIWTNPWPGQKDLSLKLVIREIRKFPYEKLTFFLDKLLENFFLLHTTYTGDTSYQIWLDLDNSLNRWKRTIFKIPFPRNSKTSVWIPYEIIYFLLGKL